MRRALAHRFPRLVMALMVVAAMLSSGGFAKHAHLWAAHSHGDAHAAACDEVDEPTCDARPVRTPCGHIHRDGTAAEHAPASTTPHNRATPHLDGECAVCIELAHLTPSPALLAPFTTVLEVLAIVHDREAAQQPEPRAPAACAARPPPVQA